MRDVNPSPAYPESEEAASQAKRLLDWYDRHRRSLPWRAPPGQKADPYGVWLSEIMLQQTTVATVSSYYERFIARWPTVSALADASLDEVLHAWQGLGYYSRARNLHACAQIVVQDHDGRFPAEEEALRRLPGIGPYTAAAIAAIAFDGRATILDGNVERVMARLHQVSTPLPQAKTLLRRHAAALTPAERPGDYAQAVMDLGATICTPRKPRCMLCPWTASCRAHHNAVEETYPLKAAKPLRPIKYAFVFWLSRPDGSVAMRRRPEKGLLAGLMEFPTTPWEEGKIDLDRAIASSPAPTLSWRALPGDIIHIFTHFRLELRVLHAVVDRPIMYEGKWVHPRDFHEHALPTLMKKVSSHVLDALR